MQVTESGTMEAMSRLEQTASRLRAIIGARAPKQETSSEPIDPVVEDAALLVRCRATAPTPAALWRDKVDKIMSDLGLTPDTATGGDDTEEKGHKRKKASSQNTPRTCVLNLMAVLDALTVDVYDVRTIPKGLDAVPCVEDETFLSVDCGLGRWRFVVSLIRDPDCVGGIARVERIVDVSTQISVEADCDLRCQSTSDGMCALLVDFMRSGGISVRAFLAERFQWANDIVDRLDMPGWTKSNVRFIATDSLSCPFESETRPTCTNAAGETLSLDVHRDALLAFPRDTPYAVYSFVRPLALPSECTLRDLHPCGDDGFIATPWGDREWLIKAGYASPWLSTPDADMRRAPVAVLGIRGQAPVGASKLAARIDTVAAIARGAYGIPVVGSDQTRDADKDQSVPDIAVRDQEREATFAHDPKHDAQEYSDHSDDVYHADPMWRNGNHCDRALNARLQRRDAPWSDLGHFSSLLTANGAIDPSRGLLVNWLISCDMLPVAKGPFEHAVRAQGLSFVRCRAHIVVAPFDVEPRSPTLVHTHVVATLHRPDARESQIYARGLFDEPGPDEAANVMSLLSSLDGDAGMPNVHSILSHYRQMQIEGVCGRQSLVSGRAAPDDDAAAVLYESAQPPMPATADAFDNAVAWLLDEFGRCAALFAAAPQQEKGPL
ncbi:hypothetical protein pkur_cds_259 [Pandoravirus kuranda]|uniref:Uncharacterized protein n=1 Tax=Pandoravirus kuranda TaxID=3019033 RepID=A0AA95EDM2_9VIRU|nr:hypothetical protein pkur_cds_259 [Pandoravirus kuranda]